MYPPAVNPDSDRGREKPDKRPIDPIIEYGSALSRMVETGVSPRDAIVAPPGR